MKIAIVEDEKDQQQALMEMLLRYEKEHDEHFVLRVFSDGIDILDDYRADYDLILMDIRMKFKDGMSTAEHIRKLDQGVQIVFITNLAQYAIAGYKVGAADFILKPVIYDQLELTLDRIRHSLHKWKKEKQLLAIDGSTRRKISTDDIYYIEVSGHDIRIHTASGIFAAKNATMRSLEKELEECYFVRGNQSQLINLKYVDYVDGDRVLVNGEESFLSRNRKKLFLQAFADYVGMEV